VRTRDVAKDLVAAAAGLGAAVGFDQALTRYSPGRRVTSHAIGLAVAGGVYPALRVREHGRARGVRELVAFALFGAVGAAGAVRGGSTAAVPVLAAAWVSHALFDVLHDTGRHSRVPRWYPAACLGYDLGVAALLVRARGSGHDA
jgi:hypothetical protein